MRPLSRVEKLVLPAAFLSATFGLVFAPASPAASSFGTATVCAAEGCVEDPKIDCVTETWVLENHKPAKVDAQ